MVRGGDDAYIHLDGAGVTQRFDLFFLQYAQEFGLDRGRDIADFVEKNRAAVGFLEKAFFIPRGMGERALFIAEQLTLQNMLGHGGAVDGNERALAAVAQGMHRPGGEVFPRARFAGNQNGEIGFGDHLDGFIHPLHLGTFAHEFLEHVRGETFMLQPFVLLEQAAAFEGLVQAHHQGIMIKGFGDEIVGTAFHGFHGHFDVTVGSHHDDGDILAVIGLDPFQQVETTDPGHFYVGKNQIIGVGAEHFQGRLSGSGRIHLASQVGLKTASQQREHVRFIIDDEKLGDHGSPLSKGWWNGQTDGERRALARIAFYGNAATVPFNNPITDRKAQPGALTGGLGGKKRIENSVQVLFGDAVSGVGHLDADSTVGRVEGGGDLDGATALDGVDGIH
ncbi:hypothetical protein DESC_780396 [Desulfosarcina cetonica]|nr:hypothetical protein DESC_780396 [Desulfosarcina cetonica]